MSSILNFNEFNSQVSKFDYHLKLKQSVIGKLSNSANWILLLNSKKSFVMTQTKPVIKQACFADSESTGDINGQTKDFQRILKKHSITDSVKCFGKKIPKKKKLFLNFNYKADQALLTSQSLSHLFYAISLI